MPLYVYINVQNLKNGFLKNLSFKNKLEIFGKRKKCEKNIFTKYGHVGTLNLCLETPDSMETELS